METTKWYDAHEVKPPKKKFKFTVDHFNLIGIVSVVVAIILFIILA